MNKLISDVVKTATKETVGKITDVYAETKRMEHEKEMERQAIEEKKRQSNKPVITVLIAVTSIALIAFWIVPKTPGIFVQLIGTLILVPLLIYLITKL